MNPRTLPLDIYAKYVFAYFVYYVHCQCCRELSLVLDGRTEPSDLVFTNGKTTLLLPPVSPISQPSSNSGAGSVQLIRSRYAGVSINSHGKNSLVSLSALVSVQHLCEQVDCNKPLFGK